MSRGEPKEAGGKAEGDVLPARSTALYKRRDGPTVPAAPERFMEAGEGTGDSGDCNQSSVRRWWSLKAGCNGLSLEWKE